MIQLASTPERSIHESASGRDAGLLNAVIAGEARLTPAQAFELYHTVPVHELGRLADARCRAIHGDAVRTYVIDRNINYTNVCSAKCTFCAFRRNGNEHDAYTLEHEAIYEKTAELQAIGGTQILMQGGMNPALPLSWYTALLSGLKERFPRVHVHAFSPPEFIEFVEYFDPPGDSLAAKIRWVMHQLREAGLDSVPGGGGEIFAPPVRRKIGLGKCDAEAWLTVMGVAHELGMFTSSTMMFGHIEGVADRIHHMDLVRRWQDASLAGTPLALTDAGAGGTPASPTGIAPAHYVSFISWPFQRENTPLGRLPDWDGPTADHPDFPGDVVAHLDGSGTKALDARFGRVLRQAGTTDYLRTQALSRLYLDNIYSIGASWVTMGPHVGQVALAYGANDMGSVMMEENVVSSAGTTYCLDEAVLCHLIRGAGFTPAQRDNTYDMLTLHDTADAPDLRVSDWSHHRTRRLHQQTATADTGVPAESAPIGLTVAGE
ncbi:MAG: radical SAM protein [Planctomycetota bacterium]